MEPVDDKAATGGVPGTGEAVATTESQAAQPQAEVAAESTAPQGWRVGDTTYTKPEEMAEAFRKFHGAFTQRSQEYSKLKAESEAAMELLRYVRNDPELLEAVRRRLNQGQAPEQAMKNAQRELKNDPEFARLKGDLDSIQRQLAQERFEAQHPDLDNKDYDAIATYIADNAEWIDRSGLSYDQILEVAWNAVFRTKMAPKLVEQGQRMAEEAITKGRKAASISSPAPTAAASRPSKPYSKMTPSEQRDYAMRIFKSHEKRG